MRLPVIFGTVTTIALLFTSLIASTNNANAAQRQTARIRNSDRLAQNSQQQADNLLTAGNQKFGTRDYAGAIADFSRAIQIAPNFEKAFYNRGV
ncbi:MAG: tetratricopeptide repeat protein, partial [Chamaesiphon sp.]|nr:tetratricopeptide repeat protein [Chamaesiphon sp.]